ncbi:MAG: hypothetical protein ACUVTO_08925 [Candidatus Caldatribacteriaceae bacterium]
MNQNLKIGVCVTALLEDDFNKTAHLRPRAQEAAQKVATKFSFWGEVVFPGLVEEEWQAQQAAEQFNRENVDLIVFTELAYTKGIVPLRMFLDTHAPILVWNTQFIESFPEEADFDLIMLNSGMCGLPEVSQLLHRIGRKFAIVSGHFEDPHVHQELGEWIQAVGAIKTLRQAKIGVIGHPFEGMADLRIDEISLRKYLGPVCWPVDYEVVPQIVSRISEAQAQALIAEERSRYGSIEVEMEMMIRSAKLALALEEMVKERKLQAVALFDQIWLHDSRIGIIPSYGTSRMVSLGIPFTCEADVPQAVSMLILNSIAGASTFLENYVVDFRKNAIVLSHDGHGNPALATHPKEVAIKPSIYYQGVHGFGASFEYAYKTGVVTLLSLGYLGEDRWKLIICEGESLPMKPRPVVAPQMLFRYSSGRIEHYINEWCKAGASHHHALAYGRWTSVLTKLASLLGLEYQVI